MIILLCLKPLQIMDFTDDELENENADALSNVPSDVEDFPEEPSTTSMKKVRMIHFNR